MKINHKKVKIFLYDFFLFLRRRCVHTMACYTLYFQHNHTEKRKIEIFPLTTQQSSTATQPEKSSSNSLLIFSGSALYIHVRRRLLSRISVWWRRMKLRVVGGKKRAESTASHKKDLLYVAHKSTEEREMRKRDGDRAILDSTERAGERSTARRMPRKENRFISSPNETSIVFFQHIETEQRKKKANDDRLTRLALDMMWKKGRSGRTVHGGEIVCIYLVVLCRCLHIPSMISSRGWWEGGGRYVLKILKSRVLSATQTLETPESWNEERKEREIIK